jgi:hypothetical protein
MDPFLAAAFLLAILVLVALAAAAQAIEDLGDDRPVRPSGR